MSEEGAAGSPALPETFDKLCAKISADMDAAKGGNRFVFGITPAAVEALNAPHIVAALQQRYAAKGWTTVAVEMTDSPHIGRIAFGK